MGGRGWWLLLRRLVQSQHILGGERLWVSLFSGDSQLSCHGEFGNKQGVQEESFTIVLEDPVDLAIVQRVLEVLFLCVMV